MGILSILLGVLIAIGVPAAILLFVYRAMTRPQTVDNVRSRET